MAELINETIKAGVVFGRSGIKPKWFIWGNKQYNISAVNYAWETRKGRTKIYHFSVSDKINLFELSYDAGRSQWKLVSVEDA